MVCELYLLKLQFKDLILVGVGLVLPLYVGFLGAFLLGAAAGVEVEDRSE